MTTGFAALALVAAVQIPPGMNAPASWTTPMEPFRVASDLYWLGSEGLASFLLTSDSGHVLIDVTLEENVELLLSQVRALGFDPADIRVVLASHAHWDHVGGTAAFLERVDAELVLSAGDSAVIARGGALHEGLPPSFPAAVASRTVGHLERITVGDVTLTAHLTPGHTPGCTSWSGEVSIEEEPLEFVSVCSLTVLSPYRLVGDFPTYPGIARDFCTSVAHLRGLTPDIFLAPHGSFVGMSEKRAALLAGEARAFVDPGSYRDYLDGAQARIEAVLGEQGHVGGCAALLG